MRGKAFTFFGFLVLILGFTLPALSELDCDPLEGVYCYMPSYELDCGETLIINCYCLTLICDYESPPE